MNPSRSVLVTGANGFIGRHVVAALRGCTAAIRTSATNPPSAVRSVRIARIDASTDWADALAGIDAVVHLAGLAHRLDGASGDAEAYEIVNTRGTLRLAEVAAAAGVRDFVFASSLAVQGGTTEGRDPFRESDPLRPAGPYGESKARAEEGLDTIASRSGMAVTAMRPPLVYGRGAPGNLARLEAALSRGVPLPFGSIRNRRAFLGIGNLVDFVGRRLAHDNRGFEAFIIADDERPSTPEFVTELAGAMGRPARLLPFPPGLLRTGLTALGRGSLADGLIASLEVDTAKARASGWRPPVGLAEGLRAAWRQDQSTVA